MEPDTPRSKRRRNEPATRGGLLHPEWRESKRTKSVSPSRSPSASGEPTLSEGGTGESRQSNCDSSIATRFPWSRASKRANAPGTSSNLSHTTSQGPVTVTGVLPTPRPTDNTRSGLEEGLRKLSIAVDTICPPLRSAIDDLTSCLDVFREAANNHREYNELTSGLESLVQQLVRHLRNAPSDDVIDAISAISEVIKKEIESIDVRHSRGGLRRALGPSGDSEDLLRRYRRIEQLFRQLQGEASMSTWNIASKQFINTQLESLHPAKLARFDSSLSTEISRRTCTENTRTKILKESLVWSEDPSAAKVYWMNGMAGTGKTTIACSIATILETQKQLAASFFCTRTSPECREAKRIVPTIAYQFARRSTPFRSALCKVLEEDPDIGTGSITAQFDLLLKRPLKRVKDKLPENLVIVVDALDECSDPHIVELFLGILFRSIADLPIKFYVTSRPEPAIRNRMMLESERLRSVLYLHEIEHSLVQLDIELYLKEELALTSLPASDIEELAKQAGNLFIYAATAVRYIYPIGKAVDSRARLSAILSVNSGPNQKLSGIDQLYSTILEAAINDHELESEERCRIQLVLWTVVCACEPILIGTLSALCGLNNNYSTTNALQSLRSVLHVSDHTEHVTTLHASFPDYILTQSRSGGFFCDRASHNRLLAQACFKIMRTQLRFNIGGIESSLIPDHEIAGLEERISTAISEELLYTCRFWADHLSMTNPMNNLLNLIHGFLSKQLLLWMEVLNLKKCLKMGPVILTKLNKWLVQSVSLDRFPDLLELGSDAYQFIISYIPSPASAYTPHIYLSALPLTAPSSLVRQRLLPLFKGLIKVSGSILNNMKQPELGTWESQQPLRSVAFSPDGNLIVLGTDAGKISVQDAYDGKCLFEPFKAHKKVVTSIGISSDGRTIVSGSHDMTISVWSIQDGTLLCGPLKGHANRVTSVNFSPDGSYIVSGSDDNTVGVWEPNDATIPMRPLVGHTNAVKSVSFSPDGTRIVSGSLDNTVRVWDLSSGAIAFIWYTVSTTSVKFSPGGTHVIAGCDDHAIRIWGVSDGPSSGKLLTGHSSRVTSIAVSPEGGRIVSGSLDHTIRVWNIHIGELIAGPFNGHTASIRSVSFSDDGTRVASASEDKTVRVWSVHSRTEPLLKKASRAIYHYRSIPVMRLTVSPDQTRFACIYSSGVEIWDMQTMDPITSIPFQLETNVNCIQFSLDGSHIFIIHESSFYICSTHTGELVNGPHNVTFISSINFSGFRSVTCSTDGTRIVFRFENSFELWDAQFHKSIAYQQIDPRGTLGYSPHYSNVTFSQGGSRFFTEINAFGGSAIYVWDANSGVCVAGPFLGKRALDLSPDGATVLSYNHIASDSGTLHLVDVDSGVDTPLVTALTSDPITAKFSPDGLHVSFLTDAGEVYAWNIHHNTTTRVGKTWINGPKSLSYSPNGWCVVYDEKRAEWLHNGQPSHENTIRADGWLLGGESQPLVWVPEALRKWLPMCSGIFCERDGGLYVDYSDMLVGDAWSECYVDDRF